METRQYQIIKKVLVFLPFYLFTFLPLNAQSFTRRIQKTSAGEGTITIHQDPAIDELVNAPIVKSTPKPKPNVTKPIATKNKPATTKPATTQKAKETPVAPQDNNTTVSNKDQTPDSVNTTPKHVFKTIGYRVQVFAGGNTRQDRQRAEQAGRSLRNLFPDEEVYVHFYSPRWICRLGNYRTYEEAHEKMLEVRNMGYSSATIVKGKITVSE